MDKQSAPPPDRPRYRWPRFVLALFLSGVALAIVWMSLEVRRLNKYLGPNPLFDSPNTSAPPGSGKPATNSTANDDLLARYRSALNGGDSVAGRKIFFERPEANCAKCHRVAGNGGDVGPALDGIGSRQTREFILESMVLPNRRTTEGYESIFVALTNGISAGGILQKETEAELTIHTSEGQWLTVHKNEVRLRQKGLSPMPEGLGQLLSEKDLRDLVEFVAGLKN